MAAPDIDPTFLTAGREFGDALTKLGLDPHALFWAYDEIEQRHVLVLVTDFFDYTGPLEISRQLFRAYNASATPKAINPFVVQLHSLRQSVGIGLVDLASNWEAMKLDKLTMTPRGSLPAIAAKGYAGLELKRSWVIHVRAPRNRTTIEISRHWKRFTRNIEKHAA